MIDSTPPKASIRASLTLPHTFGRYVLFDFIGRGGMAEIYLGRTTTELGATRHVVVKQILPAFADRERFADMLIHEAKLAAELNHASIVQVFDLGRERDRLFIAMEYVEGFDLSALLRRCSKEKVPLPLEFALHIVASTLRALDYAHRRTAEDGSSLAIVHRDVSPSNILVSFEGEVKLCDFGIAHAHDIVFGGDDAIQGKACYMSPEHASGDPLDARADIFSLGIVFWELLSGKRLYNLSDGKSALLDRARKAEIPDLPARGIGNESELYAMVMKALAFNPDDRYPNAATMLRALEDYIARSGKIASPLRFGDWLVERFGSDIVERRRMRERAAAAIVKGPLVTLTPLGSQPRIFAPPQAELSVVSEMRSRALLFFIGLGIGLAALVFYLLFWRA